MLGALARNPSHAAGLVVSLPETSVEVKRWVWIGRSVDSPNWYDKSLELPKGAVQDKLMSGSAASAFGANVRRCRARIGISQESLAARAGLDRSYVGGIERGERNPALKTIVVLASALDVGPSQLSAALAIGRVERTCLLHKVTEG